MLQDLLCSSSPLKIDFCGLGSGIWLIRRIQFLGYGVSSVLDTAYQGILGAQIRRIFLDGYGVLIVRTIIFKISLFKLQNAIISQKEIQHAACDEAWVPKADRVKISTTNMRINPTMTQKEETYQVILDIIKNTTFYKAFLATVDVPEIYLQ
ncbi:hypothetical protein Tco_0636148 [Tanacetum coccineum]